MRRVSEIVMALALPGSYYYTSSLLHIPFQFRIVVTGVSLLVIAFYLWQKRKGKSLRIQLGNNLAIDFCGALLPTLLAFASALSTLDILVVALIPLAVSVAMITSLSTTTGIILNVVRFTLTITCLSVPIIPIRIALAWLPLTTVLGVIIGSDVLPYILVLRNQQSKRGAFVIGGAGLCDAIAISYVMSVGTTSLLYIVIRCSLLF